MAEGRWHGQKHHTPGMGEALEATRWDDTGFVTAGLPDALGEDARATGRCSNTSRLLRPHSWQYCSTASPRAFALLQMVLVAILLMIQPSAAVFIDFDNCLGPAITNSDPQQLQFQPLYVWATFNSSAASHNINVTAYGNVAGIATQQPYPHWDDPQWTNSSQTVGKIPDTGGQGEQQKYTTFTTQFNVLDYTPYDPPAVRFCNSSSITQCPLAPVFNFTGNA